MVLGALARNRAKDQIYIYYKQNITEVVLGGDRDLLGW